MRAGRLGCQVGLATIKGGLYLGVHWQLRCLGARRSLRYMLQVVLKLEVQLEAGCQWHCVGAVVAVHVLGGLSVANQKLRHSHHHRQPLK